MSAPALAQPIETRPGAATSTAKYMYCLIQAEASRQFGSPGIGDRGDVPHTIHYQGLAAVVSDSAQREYPASRSHMMAHTRVLEEVMGDFTLLPVRFGTVAPSADRVRRLLSRRFGLFHGLLQEVEGRVEQGLRVFWHEGPLFQQIVEENPPIRRLKEALMGRPAEATYYERIGLGELIEQALWRRREEEAARILAPLRPLACRTRVNKVLSDRMALNAAFLVDHHRVEAFDQAVRELDREMGDLMLFKYVGPVPPYNFVEIVVSWEEE